MVLSANNKVLSTDDTTLPAENTMLSVYNMMLSADNIALSAVVVKCSNDHSWASASEKLTPASAFRHLSSQSGTALKKCRTASFYSGTGSVPASLVCLSPVPD
jgi:hypothetical protein